MLVDGGGWAGVGWVETNFSVSSRQEFKFYGLLGAFRGH